MHSFSPPSAERQSASPCQGGISLLHFRAGGFRPKSRLWGIGDMMISGQRLLRELSLQGNDLGSPHPSTSAPLAGGVPCLRGSHGRYPSTAAALGRGIPQGPRPRGPYPSRPTTLGSRLPSREGALARRLLPAHRRSRARSLPGSDFGWRHLSSSTASERTSPPEHPLWVAVPVHAQPHSPCRAAVSSFDDAMP
jgi:hypothetical protein